MSLRIIYANKAYVLTPLLLYSITSPPTFRNSKGVKTYALFA